MKFGTFHLYSVPPGTNPYDVVRQQFEQALAAEDLGFDEVWLAEHNGRTYGFSGNTVVVASSIAAATKRIRIATAVTRLPLHHPVHLAEDLAYVDILSQGRMDWGVGKGYDKHEFATYGVEFDEREERWQETFDAVRQMWSTGRTAFKGRFYDLIDGELIPLPLQRPQIPTYIMVSGSEGSVVWAAQHLLPMAIGSGPGWDDIRAKLELYAETAESAGHPRRLVEEAVASTWQLRQVHVADTTERAIDEYREGLMWYMNSLNNRAMFGFAREQQPYEYYVEHGAIVLGSPQKVVEDLLEYNQRTGINNVICWFNIGGQPHAQALRAMRLFSDKVMPELAQVSTMALRPKSTA
jgi:alkanesulfonate monooxygenase SsuD/methylene tetrahydromethanopterin reductase-like flavin-dependent oxidoreductase (luciferase family)